MITVFLPGYVEGTEDNLSEALSTCLSVYNEGTSQKIDLVFFSDAVRHAARLSRVLVRVIVNTVGDWERMGNYLYCVFLIQLVISNKLLLINKITQIDVMF